MSSGNALNAPLRKTQQKRLRFGCTAADDSEIGRCAADVQAQEKRRENAPGVGQANGNEAIATAVYFVRQIDLNAQATDIHPAEDAGNGHEAEHGRHRQEEEVVAGIDGGEADEEGDGDVKAAAFGYP
jgi:hypothetical protein